MKRRNFLAGSAALSMSAMISPAFARLQIGAGTLTSVSDGNLVLPADFIFGPMPQDELVAVRRSFNLDADTLTPECNLTLYQDGDRVILFDVGSGPDFMPSAGTIVENLDALGIAPQDVTHVVFTHAHPDHIWGLLDDFDEPLFNEATYMMGRKEWDYWWDPETVDTIGEARTVFAVGAKRRMEAIESLVALFDDGDEILPGIAAVGSFGHTPGHMSFEIRQGNEAVLIGGDAIGNHHVAFARPDWPSGSDQDADEAIRSRNLLLDRLASEQMRLIGFHLPDGGIGRVERSEGTYRFVGEST